MPSGVTILSYCKSMRLFKNRWFKEIIMLLKLSIPLFVMSVFTELPFFVTLLFVGHFSDTTQLNATLLGNSVVNISATSSLMGMATAADTLCPQCYGYKNYKHVGVIIQRGLLILAVVCVPVVVIWLNSESLLVLVRQDPCVAQFAGKYASVFILALPGWVTYIMLVKYLQAQSMVMVFTVIGLISNICLILVCSFLTILLPLGAIGASISMVVFNSLSTILLLLYIKCRKLHLQTWDGWSFKSLTEWWQFLRLGLPGILMTAFEWWSFEISTLVVGTISTTQLTIITITVTLANIYYMPPFGMAGAVTVRVGNELGAGNSAAARRAAYVSVVLQTLFTIVMMAATFASRYYIGFIFTSDKVVIAGVGDTIPVAMVALFCDQIQCVLSGIMRATGRQAIVAIVSFFSFYVVGLSLGISLALAAGMKARGAWIGLSAAEVLQTTIFTILLLKTDWEKESEKAMKNASGCERKDNHVISADTSISDAVDKEEDLSDSINEQSDAVGLSVVDSKKKSLNGGAFAEVSKHLDQIRSKKEVLLLEERSNGVLLSEQQARTCEEESCETNFNVVSDTVVSWDDNVQLLEEDKEMIKENNEATVTEPSSSSRKLFRTTSRFCQTKPGIVLGKAIVLLVCVLVLVGGAIIAATVRQHPEGCGQENSWNCSEVCLNSSLEESDDVVETSSPLIFITMPTPSSVMNSEELAYSDCLCELVPTPSSMFQ